MGTRRRAKTMRAARALGRRARPRRQLPCQHTGNVRHFVMFRGAVGQTALVAMLMLSAPVPANASGLAQLKAFVEGAKTGGTTVRPSVLPSGGERARVTCGRFT